MHKIMYYIFFVCFLGRKYSDEHFKNSIKSTHGTRYKTGIN